MKKSSALFLDRSANAFQPSGVSDFASASKSALPSGETGKAGSSGSDCAARREAHAAAKTAAYNIFRIIPIAVKNS